MKAKKALGQHFLIDENLSANIAHSLKQTEVTKNVLEVGPGRGILTKNLLEQDIKLRAVDLDKDMIDILQKYLGLEEEQVIHKDFLKLDVGSLFNEEQFLLIGNFPYNISTQIIFKMLENFKMIPEMVGMFQKEVAERIISKHGSKVYGVTSVLTQALYDGEMLFQVGPQAFSPPPKVDSSVIRLTRKESSLVCDYQQLRQVVKMSFNNRRKMLRNTLKPLVKDETLLTEKVFTLRPEHLSVDDFIALTNKIAISNES